MMICGLCLEECANYQNLYEKNCHRNEIYDVIVLYFPQMLEKQDPSFRKFTKVICICCWDIIRKFDDLRKQVAAAQLNLTASEDLETIVKLEQVDLVFNSFNDEMPEPLVSYDPQVDVLLQKDEPLKDYDSILNHNSCDSGDNRSIDDFIVGSLEQFSDEENIDTANNESRDSEQDDYDDDDDKPLIEIFKKKKLKQHKDLSKKRTLSKDRSKKAEKSNKLQIQSPKSAQHIKSYESDKFIADWKDTLPCDLCDYSAENFILLKRHFKDLHENVTPYVKCCGKKYIKRIRLVEHIKKHLDPESFKCPECGKCSANSDCLIKHLKTAHGPESREKKFKCEICLKGFALQSVLKRHMDVHATGQKDHICPFCDKGFVLEKRLKIHIKNIHCATCVCEQCGRSFRNPYTLKDHHLQEHQGIQKPKWPCDQCPAQLKSKYNLSYHKRTVHHDGSTLYVCSECGKVALNEGALMRHKKNVHEAVRKFKCTICDKAFKVAQVLREHMTIHTGEELYTCPHCPKTFRVSANMHHHRKRVHPKEWAEKRSERPYIPNTDMSHVSQKVFL